MRLLSYFHHRHLDFRRPEIESLARLFGCTGDDTVHWDPPFGGHVESPFWYLNVPSEEKAAAIAGRAVLLKVLSTEPFGPSSGLGYLFPLSLSF